MNDIFCRRSVRKFMEKDVPEEQLQEILAAALSAPSAGNEQPWHFIVIRDKISLNRLSGCSPYAHSAAAAPLAVVVCGDLSLEKHKGYWVLDCAAATENILIEAAALDLGAVWLGVYPNDERINYIKRQLALPEGIVPFAVVPIGYPCVTPQPSKRYLPERVHREQW